MATELRKAQRKRSRLKIGISAPSGGGKTIGSLMIAYGIVKGEHPDWDDATIWGKIAIVDTENGSGELYVGWDKTFKIGEYCVVSIEPPFDPQKAVDAINVCAEAGIECVIMDSLTHYWQGKGGILEKHGNVAKRSNNSYTAWRDVTPLHNQMVDAILQADMHTICTLRSKMEYVQEKDEKTGKITVRKVGLQPQQREGMEYEFTVFIEIDSDHQAFVSKDRTGSIDGEYFTITPQVGKDLVQWLDKGVSPSTPSVVLKKKSDVVEEKVEDIDSVHETIKSFVDKKISEGVARSAISGCISGVCGTANYKKITVVAVCKDIIEALDNLKQEVHAE